MRAVLLEHFSRYPAMEPQDGVKLVYQSAFGPGHLIRDRDAALAFLRRELEGVLPGEGPLYEPIGGGYARLHLAAAKARSMGAEDIFSRFLAAAQAPAPGMDCFQEGLSLLETLAARGEAPWSAAALGAYLAGARRTEDAILTEEDVLEERLMLGLRTAEGVPRGWIRENAQTRRMVREGLAVFEKDRFFLTEKGMEVQDAVVLALLQ